MIAPIDSWFLKYIHYPKLKEESKFYASYGLFMHELLEKYYGGMMSKDEILMSFLTNFSKRIEGSGRPKVSIIQNYFQSGKEFIKSLEPMPFEMVSVEEKINFDVDGIPFTGVIDYLGADSEGYAVVDNKSRKLKARSTRSKPTLKDKELDCMLRQLYLYAEAVRQKYGSLPKLLCFNCFRTGTFIKEPLSEITYHNTIEWAKRKVEEIAETEEFYPNREFFACYYICGMSNHCCYAEELLRRDKK